MKKLILPELQGFDLPGKMSQKEFDSVYAHQWWRLEPRYVFNIYGLFLKTSVDIRSDNSIKHKDGMEYYMYSFIASGEKYYDYAIITTDDFHFRTYAQWKKAVKDMTAQLIKRWKEWVRGLYREDKE